MSTLSTDRPVVQSELVIAGACYTHGQRAFEQGLPREHGAAVGFYGKWLDSWLVGWDDAEEAAADKTEAEIDLPMVGVGR